MANAKPEIHRYRRLTAWDYTRGAALFVTIVDMALASHGLALYWRPDGTHFTKESFV